MQKGQNKNAVTLFKTSFRRFTEEKKLEANEKKLLRIFFSPLGEC